MSRFIFSGFILATLISSMHCLAEIVTYGAQDQTSNDAPLPVPPLDVPWLHPAQDSAFPVFGLDRERALGCLTSAVYYEAATEPTLGQEAVAQVVLNRVKAPSYPKSVCGVVYQGSTRHTGCQFTFTCDGSLGRAPVNALWQNAERVAERALDGTLSNDLGLITHYHTYWVKPYWSGSLTEVARIGAHIFYQSPSASKTQGSVIREPEMVLVSAYKTRSGRGKPKVAAIKSLSVFSTWGLVVASVVVKGNRMAVHNSISTAAEE